MSPLKTFAAIGAALALSACAGAATRFYTLRPIGGGPPARVDYGGPPFRIDAVHVPASLDRPELVRTLAADRFVVSDNDHWAGPLGELFRRVLTQDLVARLPADKVVFPDAPKPAGAGAVVIDILAVTESGDAVAMDVSWTDLPYQGRTGPGSAPRPARQRTLHLTTPALGLGVRGNANELSALADQLAASIAAGLAAPL
jgi:uncharacterized lipoprotein YmbA